jgi:hypothetical protein
MCRCTRSRLEIGSLNFQVESSSFNVQVAYLIATKRTVACTVSPQVCCSTRPRPMGKTLPNDMRDATFLHVHYMIFESEQYDLQVLRPLWSKAESSRSAKTNSAATPVVCLTSGYWSLGFRQQMLQMRPADQRGKDSGPVGSIYAIP